MKIARDVGAAKKLHKQGWSNVSENAAPLDETCPPRGGHQVFNQRIMFPMGDSSGGRQRKRWQEEDLGLSSMDTSHLEAVGPSPSQGFVRNNRLRSK